MQKRLLVLVAGSLLLGCASQSVAPLRMDGPPPRDAARDAAVLDLLTADFAIQRGAYAVAAAKYTAVAELTGDVGLVRRAIQAALYGQDVPAAIAAAEAWRRLQPDSPDAAQLLVAFELQNGDPDAARVHLRELLALDVFGSRRDYLGLVRLLNQNVPPQTLFGVLDVVLELRPADVEALYAYTLAALELQESERAQEASERLLQLQGDVDEAVMLRAQVLQQSGQWRAAAALLNDFLKRHPRHVPGRLALARALLNGEDYPAALAAFEQVLEVEPANADARLAAALLAGQLGDLRTARQRLLQLAADGQHTDQAYFYLGKLAEDANDTRQALSWYARVKAGEHRIEALLRRAELLAGSGRLDAGIALLADAPQEGHERLRLLLARSDLLLQGGRAAQAEQLINEALIEQPDNLELLFARSMVLAKLNRPADMERDLKRILELDPDNTNALNAWGYTLADRGERLDEAHTLIRRALEQSPDNPYILDSLGWVLYRKGDLAGAERYLRQALGLLPDAEVYAHLVQVLHALGRTEEAGEVLKEALARTPHDPRLLSVRDTLRMRDGLGK
ncbi:MAG: proteolytic complex protein LbcA [Immundisolibacter sp.]